MAGCHARTRTIKCCRPIGTGVVLFVELAQSVDEFAELLLGYDEDHVAFSVGGSNLGDEFPIGRVQGLRDGWVGGRLAVEIAYRRVLSWAGLTHRR